MSDEFKKKLEKIKEVEMYIAEHSDRLDEEYKISHKVAEDLDNNGFYESGPDKFILIAVDPSPVASIYDHYTIQFPDGLKYIIPFTQLFMLDLDYLRTKYT